MRDALQLIALLARTSRGISRARWRIVAALALGALGGTFYPLLVATVAAAISRGPDRALLLRLLALCVAAPCARLASQMMFDAIGTRAIFDLRLDLCRKVLATPLARLEEIGSPRLLATLHDELAVIAASFGLLPLLAMQIGVRRACWPTWHGSPRPGSSSSSGSLRSASEPCACPASAPAATMHGRAGRRTPCPLTSAT